MTPVNVSSRPLVAFVLLLLLLPLSSSAFAASRFWIDATGGPFNFTSNWSATSGGPSGASVPVAGDSVNFDLNATYLVDFPAGTTTTWSVDFELGNVTLDLLNSSYRTTSTIGVEIGNIVGQTARLTVEGGLLEVDSFGDDITVGTNGSGFLTIRKGGQVGTVAALPDVFIGDRGATGTVTVEDDGELNARFLEIGDDRDSFGTLTVRDPLGLATSSTSLKVGDDGTGTLRLLSGGTMTSTAGDIDFGDGVTGSGSVTVSGAGSLLSMSANVAVGNAGTGSVTVSSGGEYVSGGITLGNLSSGIGSMTVSGAGSTAESPGVLDVGGSGSGTVNVSGGAALVNGGILRLGVNGSGSGRMTVSGSGTTWDSNLTTTVGNFGVGILDILDGAHAEISTLILGNGSGSDGTMVIGGEGTLVSVASDITVSNQGIGDLRVEDGAVVDVLDDLRVNDPAGTDIGTLTLDGGTIFVADQCIVAGQFDFRDGLLSIRGDVQPNPAAADLVIDGTTPEDLPTLDLVGNGLPTNIVTTKIAPTHRGALRLRQGRVYNMSNNAIEVAEFPGSDGTLDVESGASLITAGTLSLGGGSAIVTPGGQAQLTVRDGLVDVGTLRIYHDATVVLDGGEIIADAIDVFDGDFNWIEGEMRFDDAAASLDGALIENLLGPGRTLGLGQLVATAQAGQVLDLDSPLTLDGGRLEPALFSNSSELLIRSGVVSATASATNNSSGTVFLENRLASFGGLGGTDNFGLISGTGTVIGALTNQGGGRIEAWFGEALLISGNVTNGASIEVIGGEFRVQGSTTNLAGTGIISGRDASLAFDGDLTNEGALVLGGGTNDIFGEITNSPTGSIVVSGGATAIFYGDVNNNNVINVSATGPLSGAAVFFGALNGNGVSGSGAVFIEGDARPGFSPGIMSYGGLVSFGPFATLHAEIGGTTPGSEYDQLIVAGALYLNGELEVSFTAGFVPTAGMSFDLWDAGSVSGAFSSINLPTLPSGLFWHTSNVSSDGTLSVGVTPQSYAEYAGFYGLTTLPDEDQDLDNLPNLLEYALGLNPLVQDFGNPGRIQFFRSGPDDLFTFDMPVLSAPDVELQIQSGTELMVWEALATRSAGGAWIGDFPPNLEPADPGMETVTLTRPQSGDATRYYRLFARFVP